MKNEKHGPDLFMFEDKNLLQYNEGETRQVILRLLLFLFF